MTGLEGLILSLLFWISQNTDYKNEGITAQDVIVEFVNEEKMWELTCPAGPGKCPQAVAAFGIETHIIYLPLGFDSNDVLNRSQLVHELIHWLQWKNNISYRCLETREPEAYIVQAMYLRQQGIDDSTHKVIAAMFMGCPSDFLMY